MRILITNSVPLNGGDEALLRALINSLKLKYKSATIHVLCMNLNLCRKFLPDLLFEADLEFVDKKVTKLRKRIQMFLINKFRFPENSFFPMLFSNPSERKTLLLYKNADVVISSPGGFLHDFYPVTERLNGLKYAADSGKKVIICGQSIGPFWLPQSKQSVAEVFKKMHKIYLRDKISYDNLKEIEVELPSMNVTADVAFLWRKLRPDLYIPKKGTVKKVALSFRNWTYNNSNMEIVFENAVKLCNYILDDENKEICFLSTCQGIQGYVDDSVLAKEILEKICINKRNRISVDSNRYGPEKLISRYSEFDVYIGMRLHGAILAMLGGTAAMGLGYEEKTKGIFSQLDMEKYQVDSTQEFAEWKKTYDYFINDVENIRFRLPSELDRLAELATKNIEF